MELYVMRHADAEDGNGNDFSRTLTEHGRRQAEKMGDWLKRLKAFPLLVVTSPYPRAHETANIVAERLGEGSSTQPDERLAPGMKAEDASALIHEVGRRRERLLLVGHSPDLDRLVSHLIGAKDEAVTMRKGAVAHLDTVRAGFAGSVLCWLVNPKM